MSDYIDLLQLHAEDSVGGDISASSDTDGVAGNVDAGVSANAGDAEQIATATGEMSQPAEESWESLIKGKYKKEYGKAVQSAVNKRMKTHNAQHDLLDPIVQGLAKQYGIKPDANGTISLEALRNAYDNDNSNYEKEAYERGMSVDDLKAMKSLEAENARLKQSQMQEENNRYWASMEEQARALKSTFPDLDFETEMMNPEFAQQLSFYRGADPEHSVERAYRNVHFDEIMSGAVGYAVKRANSQLSRAIQSGSKRPTENGVSGGQGAVSTGAIDPSKLTRAQREDIIRRARAGERITFQ